MQRLLRSTACALALLAGVPAQADDALMQLLDAHQAIPELEPDLPDLPRPSQATEPAMITDWESWAAAARSAEAAVNAPIEKLGLLPDAQPARYPANPWFTLDDQPMPHYGARAVWWLEGELYQIRHLRLGARQVGEASWYGPGFHGRLTASGEVFNANDMTAAHRTLPLPSYVRVTHLASDQSVIVRINDRGPYHGGRIIDLSQAAAKRLGIAGVAMVAIEMVDRGPVGHLRKGISLPSESAYSLVLGNFSNIRRAEILQDRLITSLPPGVPVNIEKVPEPLRIYRVEIGPLASALEANAVIRGLRARRLNLDQPMPALRGPRR